jgi:hypothetical protein
MGGMNNKEEFGRERMNDGSVHDRRRKRRIFLDITTIAVAPARARVRQCVSA